MKVRPHPWCFRGEFVLEFVKRNGVESKLDTAYTLQVGLFV